MKRTAKFLANTLMQFFRKGEALMILSLAKQLIEKR